MALLLSISIGSDRKAFPLEGDATRIGRASQNTIQIADPTVSKEHAEIVRSGGGFAIRDLGSRNGTRVNGNEVHELSPIRDGDVIEIGKVLARVTTDPGEAKTILNPSSNLSSSLNLRAREILARGGTGNASATRLVHLLAEAAAMLVLPRPLREMCDEILRVVEQAVPATRLVILMMPEGGGEPAQIAARLRGGSSRQPLAISRSILDKVLHDCASVVIGDAAADPRFAARHSIVAHSIHSAMAVPLFDNERVLGVLYADSVDPMIAFGREELEVLTLLANMAAVKITNARLLEAEQTSQRIAQELATATRIQRALLPEPPPLSGWAIDATLETCHEVGGDLYDFHVRADGSLMFLLGDVSGKGMGAALLMSSALSSARTLYDVCAGPAELVGRLNAVIHRSTDPGQFITMFVGVLEPLSGRLSYVNAGHNPPVLIHAGKPQRLDVGGLPVGVLADARYEMGESSIEPGDLLAAFTDGIPEANRGNEMYEEERLLELLADGAREAQLEALGRRVLESVDAFIAGARRTDDITLVLLRRG
jgi:sigma-B regulation protein RsbU (phosphoserine phosphatase)